MRTLINKLTLGALALVAIMSANNANAQSAANANGNVTLKIDIRNYVQLVVNTSESTILYDNYAAYQNGVTLNQPNQLTISSNQPYKLEVKASGENFTSSTAAATIPVSEVKIKINGTDDGGSQSEISLSNANQVLSSGATSVLNRNYSFDYKTTGGSSAFFVPSAVYSTQLTYTATQL